MDFEQLHRESIEHGVSQVMIDFGITEFIIVFRDDRFGKIRLGAGGPDGKCSPDFVDIVDTIGQWMRNKSKSDPDYFHTEINKLHSDKN